MGAPTKNRMGVFSSALAGGAGSSFTAKSISAPTTSEVTRSLTTTSSTSGDIVMSPSTSSFSVQSGGAWLVAIDEAAARQRPRNEPMRERVMG